MLTVAAIGLTSKLFLRLGCSQVKVNGLPILLQALDEKRRQGRGIITVCNHISVWDDPLIWGVLPWRYYFSTRTTRWTLGASDIVFTNPFFSIFFRWGQVIETLRGRGIYQEALDTSISKLDEGAWIHMFPEGKVNQAKHADPPGGLLRFKWGVGHLMMRTQKPPVVIPMWISGFDEVMHENRKFPRFLPKLGQAVEITFGEPDGITQESAEIINKWRSTGHQKEEWGPLRRSQKAPPGISAVSKSSSVSEIPQGLETHATTEARRTLTEVLQRAVTKLGETEKCTL